MISVKPDGPATGTYSGTSSGVHPLTYSSSKAFLCDPTVPHAFAYITNKANTVPSYLQPSVSIKLEDPKLKPLRAHPTDAGADLFSTTEVAIYPGEQKMVDTGVAIKIPVGFVGLVYNRSSQGKIGIQIANSVGVIDSDYRGNIKVLLKNNGEDPYFISPCATRIAQLVISPVVLANFERVSNDEPWDDTVRGTGGFGSTG